MVNSETNEKILSESNINRLLMRDNYFVRQYYEYLYIINEREYKDKCLVA